MTTGKVLPIAAGVLGAAFCLIWGWQQLRYAHELNRWRAETWTIPGRLTAEVNFPSSYAYLRAARARERNQLPPDYAGAEELLAEALRRDPLRPEPWLRLARVLFFQGKTEEAQHALVRAETLDPRQPSTRLEAVQLWTLLGRRDKAIEAARQAAEIAPRMRSDAAQSLRVTGMSREEVFRAMAGPELPPAEALDIIRTLNPRSRETFLAMLDMLPQDAFEEPDFRSALLPVALSQGAMDLALRLWGMKKPDTFHVEGPGGARVLLHNTSLAASPMGDRLPLGWRPPPSSLLIDSTWQSATQTGAGYGVVTLAIQDSRSRDEQYTRWNFYRLIQPEGVPLRISARVRSDPAIRSEITLRAQVTRPRQRWSSEPSDWGTSGWQTITVDIPAPESDRLLELWLDRQRRGFQSAGMRVRVMLGGFDVEIPPEPDEAAEEAETP